jgi:hypothetical protein
MEKMKIRVVVGGQIEEYLDV